MDLTLCAAGLTKAIVSVPELKAIIEEHGGNVDLTFHIRNFQWNREVGVAYHACLRPKFQKRPVAAPTSE